mgnify:CR=1 FL=1
MFGDIDILLVDGLKTLLLPRILWPRGDIDVSYITFCDIVAVSESINESDIPPNLPQLNLNNPHEVIEWILKNSKEI